ncbi:universal stress protein [Streptomyces phaeochromogenes]|uniref:universal stress protein n=1 Tax=Streptomyces phaeochromogenes TaxID=1923 RepID=UPI0006E169CA|nr:universal stress protein [Streptomyces phaeochromogenes]
MAVIAWIVEGTWPACVDAAGAHALDDAEIVMLHVTGHEIPDAAHGAFAGLPGRGHPERDPGTRLEHLAATATNQLLQDSADRLGRPCTRMERTGRVEREVVAAAQGAELLIVARDGDRSRPGPKSIGPASRFVVDHAPCPVLLIWPEPTAGLAGIPPLPHHG